MVEVIERLFNETPERVPGSEWIFGNVERIKDGHADFKWLEW